MEVILEKNDWLIIRVKDEKGSRGIGLAVDDVPELMRQLEEKYLAIEGGES